MKKYIVLFFLFLLKQILSIPLLYAFVGGDRVVGVFISGEIMINLIFLLIIPQIYRIIYSTLGIKSLWVVAFVLTACVFLIYERFLYFVGMDLIDAIKMKRQFALNFVIIESILLLFVIILFLRYKQSETSPAN
jgi:hypothetical protein